MDNVSHSLAGFALAESIYQCVEKKTNVENPKLKNALWALSFIANNFTDLDYFYVLLFQLKRLGALLHHRGHTHTFVGIIPQAAFVLGAFYFFSNYKKWKWNLVEWGALVFTVIAGFTLHIGMDAINSYGVHPFWPFNNQWYYGDSVFIVEPVFWIALCPVLFLTSPHIILRVIFSTLFLAILILVWISGSVLPELALVLTLFAGLLAILVVQSKKRRYLYAVGWLSPLLLIGVFHQISKYSKSLAEEAFRKESPGIVIHDLIMSPLPANPFCWGSLAVTSLGPVKTYKVRRFITTPFPGFISVQRCLKLDIAQRHLQLGQPVSLTEKIHTFGLQEFSIERFRELAKDHCGASEFLKFSRVPAFEEKEGKLVLRDMRFDLRSPNFTMLEFPLNMPKTNGCGIGANWDMPREDLLR